MNHDPNTDPEMGAVARMTTAEWSRWLIARTRKALSALRHVTTSPVPPAPSLAEALKPKPAAPILVPPSPPTE